MRILTLQQPWAWLIAQGYKDVENRTWRTSYRGLIAIHAGLRRSADYADGSLYPLPAGTTVPAWSAIERGGIVAVCELVDCVTESVSPWFAGAGHYGFVLGNVRGLPFIPCRGGLGLRTLPPEIEGPVQEALRAADSHTAR